MKHNTATPLQLVEFITRYMYQGKEREVERAVKSALGYNTGDYGMDDRGVVYALLYEVGEETAHVIDLIIREDCRGDISLYKYIIGRNWSRFPWVKSISFERGKKYPYRDKRVYDLLRFFKKGVKNGRDENSSTIATEPTNSR